jgi:hypothetical protein
MGMTLGTGGCNGSARRWIDRLSEALWKSLYDLLHSCTLLTETSLTDFPEDGSAHVSLGHSGWRTMSQGKPTQTFRRPSWTQLADLC